jgi:hypothetical protein
MPPTACSTRHSSPVVAVAPVRQRAAGRLAGKEAANLAGKGGAARGKGPSDAIRSKQTLLDELSERGVHCDPTCPQPARARRRRAPCAALAPPPPLPQSARLSSTPASSRGRRPRWQRSRWVDGGGGGQAQLPASRGAAGWPAALACEAQGAGADPCRAGAGAPRRRREAGGPGAAGAGRRAAQPRLPAAGPPCGRGPVAGACGRTAGGRRGGLLPQPLQQHHTPPPCRQPRCRSPLQPRRQELAWRRRCLGWAGRSTPRPLGQAGRRPRPCSRSFRTPATLAAPWTRRSRAPPRALCRGWCLASQARAA